jgi:predicted short-subunit dehydrogenase-like oxidoreductase (DUF2520 family)
MFTRVKVVGLGRVGSAINARLEERGLAAGAGDADLVLLCVPDQAIAEVATRLPTGPWVAHVSGATPLSSLAPHERRFGLHPLQTFTRSRGAEQIDGSWAAVTSETDKARARGWWLADRLGLRAFDLRDERRVLYHAGAAMASNFLVTLYRSASLLFERAGAPSEALIPLMRRTIENGFDLTGPIARGDLSTVEAHEAAIHAEVPDLEPLYRALAQATRT